MSRYAFLDGVKEHIEQTLGHWREDGAVATHQQIEDMAVRVRKDLEGKPMRECLAGYEMLAALARLAVKVEYDQVLYSPRMYFVPKVDA